MKKLFTGMAIVLLHLPLVFYVFTLTADLAPGQGVTDLDAVAILTLLALLLLPYGLLAALGIRWNPERARLNEITD